MMGAGFATPVVSITTRSNWSRRPTWATPAWVVAAELAPQGCDFGEAARRLIAVSQRGMQIGVREHGMAFNSMDKVPSKIASVDVRQSRA
jgi:hypothetical protein